MDWTTDKPISHGWYFARSEFRGSRHTTVCFVNQNGINYFNETLESLMTNPLAVVSYQPIPEPKN